jgi:hypothetical protein
MHVFLSTAVKMVDNVFKMQQLLIVTNVYVQLVILAKDVRHLLVSYVCVSSSSFYRLDSYFLRSFQLLDAIRGVKMVVRAMLMFVYVLQVILEHFVKQEVAIKSTLSNY